MKVINAATKLDALQAKLAARRNNKRLVEKAKLDEKAKAAAEAKASDHASHTVDALPLPHSVAQCPSTALCTH